MITQSALARIWGVSQPAVAKLVKRGMPLTSEEDARAWKVLESQRRGRTKPPALPTQAAGAKPAAPPAPRSAAARRLRQGRVAAGEGKTGAEHALARLEAEENAAHERLQYFLAQLDAADSPSDALVIASNVKLAREDWLKVSESLRKYDLLVEASRRDSGHLIPRAESEQACELAALWLRLAVRTFIGSYVERIIKAGNNPPAVVRLIEDGMEAGVNTSLMRSTDCRVSLQPWAIAAVRRGYGVGGDAPLPDAPIGGGDDDAD